jgi:hypothetical protein
MLSVQSAIVLLVAALFSVPAYAQINYSKTTDVSPLRISFAQLQDVLGKAALLMKSADTSNPIDYEQMELRAGELSVKMTGHVLEATGVKIPNVIDKFSYNASTRDPAPISRLQLSFSDDFRTLSVEGQTPEQVDAVFAVVSDDLSKMSSSFGGRNFRSFGVLLFPVLASGLVIVIFYWFESRRPILFLPVSLIIALLAALIFLPFNVWLAGFSAVQGDAAFLVRYGPEITFAGFLLSIVGIAVPFLSRTAGASGNK